MNTTVSWLAEDPELLQTALEIVDAWGDSTPRGHAATASVSDAAPSSSSLVVTMLLPRLHVTPLAVTASQRDKSSHSRRRKEVLALRAQAEQLERELAALALQRAVRQELVTVGGNLDSVHAVMWSDIAARQLLLRQQVELEQAHLRSRLETQVQVARELVKLLERAQTEQSGDAQTAKRRKLGNCVGQGPCEAEQIARIEVVYRNLACAYSFSMFYDGTIKFVESSIRDDGDAQIVIEVSDAWTVPFGADRVADALWEYTLTKNDETWRLPQCDVTRKLRDNGIVLVSRFFASTTSDYGLTCHYDGQAVVKRFGGSSDAVHAIVSNMHAAPSACHKNYLCNMVTTEDSCTRVLPVGAPSSDDGRQAVCVQSHLRFHITFDNSHGRKLVDDLTRAFEGKMRLDVEKKRARVETILLR